MKTISVYIPTHNRPVFLQRALDSLARQNIKNFQVLVYDDGSRKENKSKVIDIISQYKNIFSDLVFFNAPEPKGACYARNKMIDAADGEFITGLDDDDEFTPDRLSSFLYSKELSRYAYLSAGMLIKDGNAEFNMIEAKGVITLEKLKFHNAVGNQVFTRTEYLKKVGGFDEKFSSWQDYDLWFRLTDAIGPGYKIQRYTYTLHIEHELARITNSAKVKDGYLAFINKHGHNLGSQHLKSLAIQNMINSSSPLTARFVFENLTLKTLYPMSWYWAKKNTPFLFSMLKKLKK